MIKEDKVVPVEEEEESFDSEERGAKNQSLESFPTSHIIHRDLKMSADDESISTLRNLSTFSPSIQLDPSQKMNLSCKPEEIPVFAEERSSTTDMNRKESIPTTVQQLTQLLPQKCQICGQCSMNNTRSMLRFLPTASAKSDISLHVFCGKIASISPQIDQPHLEILIASGLKNKHGIGPSVNFALARTRSAVAVGGEAEKDPRRLDKQYYLVQEFEENLKSIRGLQQLNRKGIVTSIPPQIHSASKPKVHKASKKTAAFKGRSPQQKKRKRHTNPTKVARKPPSRQAKSLKGGSLEGAKSCTILHSSSTTTADIDLTNHRSSLKKRIEIATVQQGEGPPSQTRIKCACGGSYKGPSRLKAHLKTPRHLLWESLNASARNTADRNQTLNTPIGQQSSSRELEQTSVNGIQQTNSLGLQQANTPLGQQSSSRELEQISLNGIQQTNSLGLQQQANSLGLQQQANSLGLQQQANSLGLQQASSLGLQQRNSPGLQQNGSLGLQQSSSIGLQQINSHGLQQTDFLRLEQIIKNQENINLAQLRTLLEQEGNRSPLLSHSGDNPSLSDTTQTEDNAIQVNNIDELTRQLVKSMLQGSNIGNRQGATSLGANSQSLSQSLFLLLLLLSERN